MAGNEWRETTVGALCDEGILHTQTGPFGSQLHSYDYVPIGIPVVPTEGIGRRRLLTEGIPEVGEETAARLSRHRLKSGDILFARRGVQATGLSAIVTPKQEGWICGTGAILLRTLGDSIHPEFLSFLLSSDESIQWLKQHAVGAVMPNLNEGVIRQLPLTLPPLAEQKAIAAVLGALDDKIELNRRMNATLEAMARALFQSWFVDFDPVRAKLDGRMPVGLDPATAALFPDSFQDSEAGHIPKGWTVGKVSDLATLNRGAINPGDFPSETFDHYSLPAFDNGRTPKVELGNAIMSNKFTVTLNSVLLSKLNPHIPRIWLPDLHASHRSVCSTEFMVACSQPGVTREYLFSIFTSSAFASIYGTLVTGTTGSHQRIRPDSVLGMKIVIPFAALIRAFTDIVKPMLDGINRNTDQSRTLATLRDTLLQKLLSGELSVGELNPITEADP
jgi:type I restriction enzyme, S subunit